jgi:hypothetical protein
VNRGQERPFQKCRKYPNARRTAAIVSVPGSGILAGDGAGDGLGPMEDAAVSGAVVVGRRFGAFGDGIVSALSCWA